MNKFVNGINSASSLLWESLKTVFVVASTLPISGEKITEAN